MLLGSNIDPAANIRRGALMLSRHYPILQSSSVWLTHAVGTSGPDFYNAAVKISTNQTAEDLKFQILRPLEQQLGRIRSTDKYAPRTIDLDVILLDGTLVEPRLWDTAFILLPVSELVPDLLQPGSGHRLDRLAKEILASSGASVVPDFPLILTGKR